VLGVFEKLALGAFDAAARGLELGERSLPRRVSTCAFGLGKLAFCVVRSDLDFTILASKR